jgi:hypothetical protein
MRVAPDRLLRPLLTRARMSAESDLSRRRAPLSAGLTNDSWPAAAPHQRPVVASAFVCPHAAI